jgi:hypothetical protein
MISAELRSHSIIETPVIVLQSLELCFTVTGNDTGLARRSGVGHRQETVPIIGTTWLSLSPVSEMKLSKPRALRPDAPVIKITVFGDADTKRKALEDGAEPLFTKPIGFGTLRGEIDMRVESAAYPALLSGHSLAECPLLAPLADIQLRSADVRFRE